MDNIFGDNVKIYKNVVLRFSKIGENCIIADDVFLTNSVLGKDCTIERRGMIFDSEIGDYSYTGYNTVVKYAVIGKFTSISWNVSIGGANHDFNHMTSHPFPFKKKYGFAEKDESYSSFEQPLIIGNDVWIGSNVCIMRGVTIGNGAVIGAGAVVTHNVPPYEIWAGVPAKKIGQRFSDEFIDKLEKIAWWNLSDHIIRDNINLFKNDVSLETIQQLEDIFKKNNGFE